MTIAAEDDGLVRCRWAGSLAMRAYHDAEWGVPVHDDRALFELLTLEGAQAGLSWRTILDKREGYRRAFAGFDIVTVAGFDATRVDSMVADPAIVRHRGKIEAAIGNARAILALRAAHGTFDAYLWAYVRGRPVVSRRTLADAPPASTPLSDRLSRDLRAQGFRFVGTTIVYAFLQAAGLVDDHAAECFRAAVPAAQTFPS